MFYYAEVVPKSLVIAKKTLESNEFKSVMSCFAELDKHGLSGTIQNFKEKIVDNSMLYLNYSLYEKLCNTLYYKCDVKSYSLPFITEVYRIEHKETVDSRRGYGEAICPTRLTLSALPVVLPVGINNEEIYKAMELKCNNYVAPVKLTHLREIIIDYDVFEFKVPNCNTECTVNFLGVTFSLKEFQEVLVRFEKYKVSSGLTLSLSEYLSSKENIPIVVEKEQDGTSKGCNF